MMPAIQYCEVDHNPKNEGYAVVASDHVMIATAISQVALISTLYGLARFRPLNQHNLREIAVIGLQFGSTIPARGYDARIKTTAQKLVSPLMPIPSAHTNIPR